MNSNDAINQNFIPYPYTFPAIKFVVEQTYEESLIKHKETIAEMRDWLADCDMQDVDEFDDSDIVRFVANNYDGGIEQFIRDANPS